MKRAFAAFLIAAVCATVFGAHAWKTWGAADYVSAASQKDKDLFEYSLFLESFAFMLSAAYWVGPRVYRFFSDESAAVRFEGEKERISRIVHTYSAVCVILRRICLDPKMNIPISETLIAIGLISAPAVWTIAKTKYAARAKNA